MQVGWTDYLSVGVAEIDGQHKLLFEKFNALLAACEKEAGADEVHRLFSFLERYVITHFSDEERLMHKLDFPDVQKHVEMHQDFVRQVDALKERLTREGPTQRLISSLTLTINGWLIEHISRTDRAFGRFVKEKKAQNTSNPS